MLDPQGVIDGGDPYAAAARLRIPAARIMTPNHRA